MDKHNESVNKQIILPSKKILASVEFLLEHRPARYAFSKLRTTHQVLFNRIFLLIKRFFISCGRRVC